jgi:hypothetical protein
MGPSRGKGPDAKWRVIDSRGHHIASGFLTQAYALRWIDSFNLLRVGHCLNDHDHKSLLWHWHSIRPVQMDPETSAPTESARTSVLTEN